MNSKLFVILIAFIILLIFKCRNVTEKMEDCSSRDLTLEKNPIFLDLEDLLKKYNIEIKIDDFSDIDNDNIELATLTSNKEFYNELTELLNSYRIYNPIYDIVVNEKYLLSELKNEILKIIILNHLNCYGERDVELFWIRLHLINKNVRFTNKIETFKAIEPFTEKITNNSGIESTNVISYDKHKQNIVINMLNKYPELISTFVKDYNMNSEMELKKITDKMLQYLMNLNLNELSQDKKKQIHSEMSSLYQDLRELVLIDRVMQTRPDKQYGFSDNDKTFRIDYQVLLNNDDLLEKKLKDKRGDFIELFESLKISKSDKFAKELFFQKLRIYLNYHKIDVPKEYTMLHLNSIKLDKLHNLKYQEIKLNTFAENLHDLYFMKINKKTTDINEDTVSGLDNLPLRFKQIDWIENIK